MLHRLHALLPEAGRFGMVGGIGFLVDVGCFNMLRYAGEPGLLEDKPLTAKALSVVVATCVTYLGNRHWTWSHRQRSGVKREVSLFFLFNGLAMVIALTCLAFSHYWLDLRSPLADNISANGFGLVLGMAFRFWTYRTFVFRKAPAGDHKDSVSRR
ncbi:MAG: GtrA family protein [Nocardioidaceae bacterium]